jgi:hypothetical protein
MEQIKKTRRWLDDEYMVVSGLKVVYTVDKKTGQLLVRMPGRTTKSVEELRNQGRSVMMPTTLRVD